ncbi:MAG: creatininase family protein [Chloroflexota bacterium]
MSELEVRIDRLRPREVAERMAAGPVAWIPLGAVEYHAEHLPFGTDGFTATAVVERAARIAGGVVLPWSALTIGTLALPWSLRYDADLVERALRSTIEQAAAHGARVVVVHTGHGPLDLNHLVKRVCAETEERISATPGNAGFRAYGLCYLELNAALGTGLGTDWPVAVDHGAIMETSWTLAIAPELVALDRLPADPDGTMLGVYGPNPRTRASATVGAAQVTAAAGLLAERVRALLAGGRIDPMVDLRAFVARYWPEPPAIGLRADGAALTIHNPGPVSRYLTRVALTLDGVAVDPAHCVLRNPTPGEAGVPVPCASLGPEAGFYVRRLQDAELDLPAPLGPGSHAVALTLGLGGVAETTVRATLVRS